MEGPEDSDAAGADGDDEEGGSLGSECIADAEASAESSSETKGATADDFAARCSDVARAMAIMCGRSLVEGLTDSGRSTEAALLLKLSSDTLAELDWAGPWR